MGIGAVVIVIQYMLKLIVLPNVDWLPVLVMAALGGLVGMIPYLPERLVNQRTAAVWLVVVLAGMIVLGLWRDIVTRFGFFVCMLVMAIGYFWGRMLSAKQSK